MKLHILEIQDGNGCRLIAEFNREKLVEKAREWLSTRSTHSAASQALLNDHMDRLCDGEQIAFINASIQLRDTDIDLSGVLEVLEDARHTLGRNHKLLQELAVNVPHNIHEALDRASSRYLATEQALFHTAEKLRRKA